MIIFDTLVTRCLQIQRTHKYTSRYRGWKIYILFLALKICWHALEGAGHGCTNLLLRYILPTYTKSEI
jgi:hypothetical protein